jgi:hypothetical protein
MLAAHPLLMCSLMPAAATAVGEISAATVSKRVRMVSLVLALDSNTQKTALRGGK